MTSEQQNNNNDKYLKIKNNYLLTLSFLRAFIDPSCEQAALRCWRTSKKQDKHCHFLQGKQKGKQNLQCGLDSDAEQSTGAMGTGQGIHLGL